APLRARRPDRRPRRPPSAAGSRAGPRAARAAGPTAPRATSSSLCAGAERRRADLPGQMLGQEAEGGDEGAVPLATDEVRQLPVHRLAQHVVTAAEDEGAVAAHALAVDDGVGEGGGALE